MKAEHRPEYDAIKAIAVAFIAIAHWFPGTILTSSFVWGRTGVVVLFVLSGMLTGRLLERAARAKGATKRSALLRYACSRFVTVIPPYVATVGIVALTGYAYVQENLLPLLTFTANLDLLKGTLYGNAVHLWVVSLIVQFYALWAVIYALLPASWRLSLVAAMLVVGVAWRIGVSLSGGGWLATAYMLPGCLDSFAIGLLLTQARSVKEPGFLVAVCGMALLALMAGTGFKPYLAQLSVWFAALQDLAIALLAASIIIFLDSRQQGLQRSFVITKVLGPLGIISYGFFLWHFFAVPFWDLLGFTFTSIVAKSFAYVGFAFTAALLSWVLVEKPALRLRDALSLHLTNRSHTAEHL